MSDKLKRMLVLATDANLKRLYIFQVNIADEIFYSCPRPFSQLYTLPGSINGPVFPLVFTLHPSQIDDTYVQFFQAYGDAIFARDLVVTAVSCLLDFETSRNPIITVFPQLELG